MGKQVELTNAEPGASYGRGQGRRIVEARSCGFHQGHGSLSARPNISVQSTLSATVKTRLQRGGPYKLATAKLSIGTSEGAWDRPKGLGSRRREVRTANDRGRRVSTELAAGVPTTE